MPVLDPPRQAAVDLLDLLGEVLAAAGIITADAVAWARNSEPQTRLQLVPPLHLEPQPGERGPPALERRVRAR